MQAPYILSEAPAASSNAASSNVVSSNASSRTRSHGWTERVTWTAYTVTNSLYTETNSPNMKTSCSLVKSRDRLQKTHVCLYLFYMWFMPFMASVDPYTEPGILK